MVRETSQSSEDEGTGLPLLRTWAGVYVVVTAILAVAIALLTALSVVFA
ncbi:MAG: hypothetical protein ABSH22_06365 [Tepidisphaeraceae bacterium]|jgi:hypothetical protein